MAAFLAAGATLRIPESIALTGEDGRTWRPDKAPQAVKDAIEARRKAEAEKRRTYEIPYGQVMFRPAGSREPFRELGNIASEDARAGWFIRNDPYARMAAANMAREVIGDGPIIPSDDADDLSGTLAVRPGPDQPFQVLRGQERQAAILSAIKRGVIARYALVDGSETVTVPARNDPARYTTQNQDGTWTLRLDDYVFRRVMPTGDIGVGDTVTFRLTPQRQARPVRVMRTLDGGLARFVEPWLGRPWTEAPEDQAASEVRSGIEFDQDGKPVASHVSPARERAAIEADIERIEEDLAAGRGPVFGQVERLRGLHREFAQVDGRPLPEGTPRFVRMAPMGFLSVKAAMEMMQEPGSETPGEAA
ncbi:hypothetical protein Maq22A_c13915 [Methylobacterium aquaticum]|uniref:Uncharacterized protein n=1 Tax=Methylobacterium aquaticum TaxID=270351 RepID=A0A0C6FBX1_9HYPH|nr:hypothetical protein Maq22A_c13915 [Methylobacterium aquaticum]